MRSGLPPTRQKNWQPQLSKNVIQKQPWPPSRARPTPRGKTKAQGNRQRLVALGAEVIGIGQSSSSCKHNPEALPGFPWGVHGHQITGTIAGRSKVLPSVSRQKQSAQPIATRTYGSQHISQVIPIQNNVAVLPMPIPATRTSSPASSGETSCCWERGRPVGIIALSAPAQSPIGSTE